MSDLQCAARFVLLGDAGPSMVDPLRHERVAAVYAGEPGAAAGALGESLGLPVQALARPLVMADVLAEDPDAVADLRDLADLHRGETVVVTAVARPGQRVDVAVDSDGISLVEVSPGAST